ncbi:hypothetical protein U1Q18_015037 [Sarracenia purpurea var. burkii]
MAYREVRIKIAEHWDHGFDAFRELAQAKWLEIDFDLIEPGGEGPLEQRDAIVDATVADDADQPGDGQPANNPEGDPVGNRESEETMEDNA